MVAPGVDGWVSNDAWLGHNMGLAVANVGVEKLIDGSQWL